ncbi:hypothetical protein BCAH1134_C0454 (plasmid) [Bacillus cereus AH1134]|nr:hypothetical protein BCAH1134_C0454 [Bacillus cereus AH1134]
MSIVKEGNNLITSSLGPDVSIIKSFSIEQIFLAIPKVLHAFYLK